MEMKINFNAWLSLGNSDLVHIKREKGNRQIRYLRLREFFFFNFKPIISFKISLKEKKDKECKSIFINENVKHATIF